MLSCGVVRLFLVIWLAAFAVQSTELLAGVVPDDCVEETRGAADSCPQNCARCVCCARLPMFVAPVLTQASLDTPASAAILPPTDFSTSAFPRGVLHVPKTH